MRRVVLKAHGDLEPDAIVIDFARCRIGFSGSWTVEGNTLSFRFRTFVCVAAASTQFCGRDDMIEFIYGDDPDGGPLNPWNRISVYFYHNTRWLERAGIAWRNRWGRGFEAKFIEQARAAA